MIADTSTAEVYRREAAKLRRIAPALEPEPRKASRAYARRLLRWAARIEKEQTPQGLRRTA